MSFLERQQTQIKDTTVKASVPNNDVAKVMYYLNCACSCINYNDNDIAQYRNYANWASLSDEEDRLVFYLALVLNPDILIEKVFFPSDELCRDMSNRFYEINQVRHQFAIVPSTIVAGRTCNVSKIMTYKQAWMRNNYFEPMFRLQQRFRPAGGQQQSSSLCVIS